MAEETSRARLRWERLIKKLELDKEILADQDDEAAPEEAKPKYRVT